MTGSEQFTQRPESRGLEDRVALDERAAAEPAVLEHHLGALEFILSAHGADGRHGVHRRAAEIADVVFPGHIVVDVYGHDAAVGLSPCLENLLLDASVENGICGTLCGQLLLLLVVHIRIGFRGLCFGLAPLDVRGDQREFDLLVQVALLPVHRKYPLIPTLWMIFEDPTFAFRSGDKHRSRRIYGK